MNTFEHWPAALRKCSAKKGLHKGWLAIEKLKPLSFFISRLLMLRKALDNVKIGKWKVKVVSALHPGPHCLRGPPLSGLQTLAKEEGCQGCQEGR